MKVASPKLLSRKFDNNVLKMAGLLACVLLLVFPSAPDSYRDKTVTLK